MIHNDPMAIVVAALFLPFLSQVLAISFGVWSLMPDFRASLKAIATAYCRLLTFLPLPDLSVPSFFSFITL
jgi:hypothetical protein